MYLVFAIIAAFIGAHLLGGDAARAAAHRRAVLQRGRRHAERPSVEHRRDGARPDHGVLRRHAGADRRVRQLVRAADDRRAGHGLPAHEQHQLLAAAAGLHPAAAVGRRSAAASAPAGRSIRRSPIQQGAGMDLAIFSLHLAGASLDPGRDQLHHHDLQHARAGHDPAPHAAVRLVDPGDGLPAAARPAGAGRRHHHAADRPQLRHALLRSGRRRRPDAVPAPLLVLRPSRGVHHDPAGLRHRQPHHLDLLQEADLRLSRHGLRDGGDRRRRLRGVGASHVHRRHGRRHARLLRRRHDGDRGADRREDLLLDRHHVGRLDQARGARCCGRSASSSCSPSAA